jgi:phage terminase small subunit
MKPPVICRKSHQTIRDRQIWRIVRGLQLANPHLDDRSFLAVLRSYARLSLLIERGYTHLKERGIVNARGELRDSVDTVRRLMLTQAALARELGLTPAARAGLGGRSVFEIPERIAHRVIEVHASRAANGQDKATETE